ncbi:MAG: cytochrome c biogenesis protein ResB [Gammaproteobacteria bacterium]
MSETSNTASVPRLLLRFLGSMNLAITLLVALAIAAVIGTVLQQNQPYPDYVLKFGPFWFEIFKLLDLYDVYASTWFLTILSFLVLSTGVCVYRNTPRMLKDLSDYREKMPLRNLRKQEQLAEWRSAANPDAVAQLSTALLKHKGYRLKFQTLAEQRILAAKKGSGSRLGYLFTHAAIVIICIGGLLDGNVPLKFAQWRGGIQVETRDIPAGDVPPQSTLPVDNPSFRATVNIPEGEAANLAFINFKDGYLVQKLPFIIRVDDFRIESYESGQPKSFESDLTIIDDDLVQPLKRTIAVNHPLSYKGYTIYQASFGDGGSRLHLKLWPLRGEVHESQEVQAVVNEPLNIAATTAGGLTLEIGEFRPFNVNPDTSGVKKFRNLGPSFQYKLRKPTGEALEYLNYMQPIEQQGAWFYLSGMRKSPTENFSYWFIPADADKRLERYMHFALLLRDKSKVAALARKTVQTQAAGNTLPADQQQTVAEFMQAITQQFIDGGLDNIAQQLEQTVPEAQRQEVAELYSSLLQHFLRSAYLQVLQEEGVDTAKPLSDFDALFFNNAVTALGLTASYAAPLFIELRSFEHREATGLQITRAPGKWLVFPGCVLLATGVFLMFYLPQRRIWIAIGADHADGVPVLLAGHAQRNRYDFDSEFNAIRTELVQRFAVR